MFSAREQSFVCHHDCFRSRLHDPASLAPSGEIPEDREEEAVLDACGELAHELFTAPDTLPFRDRLFASEPGRWLSVAELCAGVESAERRLAEIAAHDPGFSLLVQHTPDPLDPADEYALVIFAELYYLWTTAVLHLRGA